jgi:hypothetical protein
LQLRLGVCGIQELVRNRPPKLLVTALDHFLHFNLGRIIRTTREFPSLLDLRLITSPTPKDKEELDSVYPTVPLNNQLPLEVRVGFVELVF